MSHQPAADLTQLTNFIDSLAPLSWPLYQAEAVALGAGADRRKQAGWSPVALPNDFAWSLLPRGKGQEVNEIEVQYAIGGQVVDEAGVTLRELMIKHFDQLYGASLTWEDKSIRFTNHWWEHPAGLRLNLRFDDDPYWELFISGPLVAPRAAGSLGAGSGSVASVADRLELMSVSDAVRLVEKLVAAPWPFDVPQLMRFTRALGWTPIAESNVYFYTNYGKTPLGTVALPTAERELTQERTRVPEASFRYTNGYGIQASFSIASRVAVAHTEVGERQLRQRMKEIIAELDRRFGKGTTFPTATEPVSAWHLPRNVEIGARYKNGYGEITVSGSSVAEIMERLEKPTYTAQEALEILDKWLELQVPITAEYADYLAQNLGWERTREPFTQNYYTEFSHPGRPKVVVTEKDGVVAAVTLDLGNFSSASDPVLKALETELQALLTERYGDFVETEQGIAKFYMYETESAEQAVHLLVSRTTLFLTVHFRQEADLDIEGQIEPEERLQARPFTTPVYMGFFFGVMVSIMLIVSFFR